MASPDMNAVMRLLSPSLVVVETPGRVVAGFLVGPQRVLTCLHAVTGQTPLVMRLPDASSWITEDALAVDAPRDLLALPVNAAGQVPLRVSHDAPALGPGLALYTVQSPGSAQSVVPVRVMAVHSVGGGKLLAQLDRRLPETASGAPLVTAEGALVGLVTTGVIDEKPVTLAMPLYVDHPVLTGVQRQPLQQMWEELAQPRQEQHPLHLLDGSETDGVRALLSSLAQAIERGAPTYNRGDFEGCARIYEQTALRLVTERADCPGAVTLLEDGLRRARDSEDANARAWALRDCFDGVISLGQRWLEAHPKGGGKVWMN